MQAVSMEPLWRWAALAMVGALPFALSVLAIASHQRQNHGRRGAWLPVAAGPWLEHQISRLGLPVSVEAHPRDGLDAYWPSVGAIGLSERTWGGCRPGHWAIAAHELGHALNMATHPAVAQILPTARLAQGLSWRAFVAALLCTALCNQPGLLPLALGFLLISVTASAVVCADELMASVHGDRLLRADTRLRGEGRDLARGSLVSAGLIYGVGLLGQLVALALWPQVAQLAVTTGATSVSAPGPVGVMLSMVLTPILVLRAAHVLGQILRPEPVTTDFRLFTVMHREAQWEFLSGIGVLVVVIALHPLASGPLGALALVLATTTAIGPVGGLARALILFPVLLLLYRRAAHTAEEDDEAFFGSVPRPDEAAPALMALYSDPPWYLRVSWIAHLAYLPLLAVLLVGPLVG